MKAMGINIFGGGFTLGVLQSKKFEVVAQLEQCNAGKRTYDMNPQYFGKIPRPLAVADWPIAQWRGELDFVYANPPCAPWSAGNTRKGMLSAQRFEDPRLDMTRVTMETALQLRPDAFALESVARAFSIGRSYYDGWAEKFMAAGYGVTYYLTDALLLGVPSTRQRFHFVASRFVIDFPEPDMLGFIPQTVRSACWDIRGKFNLSHHKLEEVKPNALVMKTMKMCEPGGQMNAVERALPNYDGPKHSFMVRRAMWDAPAFTVIKLDEIVHPDGERWMTLREGLRLCSYPDDFRVAAPNEATQAVLPLVGRHVAVRVAEGLERGERAARAVRIVDHRALAAPYRPGRIWGLLRDELI